MIAGLESKRLAFDGGSGVCELLSDALVRHLSLWQLRNCKRKSRHKPCSHAPPHPSPTVPTPDDLLRRLWFGATGAAAAFVWHSDPARAMIRGICWRSLPSLVCGWDGLMGPKPGGAVVDCEFTQALATVVVMVVTVIFFCGKPGIMVDGPDALPAMTGRG